jgi:hypothetical protein
LISAAGGQLQSSGGGGSSISISISIGIGGSSSSSSGNNNNNLTFQILARAFDCDFGNRIISSFHIRNFFFLTLKLFLLYFVS